MPALLGRRRLEWGDQDPLWVEVSDDMGDRAVLAAAVHPLKDDEQRPLVLREESLLKVEQSLPMRFEIRERALVVLQAWGGVGIDVGHPETAVARHGAQQLAHLLLRHRASLGLRPLGQLD